MSTQSSWFILSVLFLTEGDMLVVPKHDWDPPLHRPPPWQEHLPDQLVHSVCAVFDRRWDITQMSTLVGTSTWTVVHSICAVFWQAVRHLWTLQVSRIPSHTDLYPGRNVYPIQLVHSVCVVFDRGWDVGGSYTWLGSPITQTCTLVGTSTRPAGSFCLCWFLIQAVRSLWFQHVSKIPLHMDLHPGRNVYSTSHFILSVLFFDRKWDICDPYRCAGSAVTQISTLVGMSTQPAGSFCLCCLWQAVRHLWSLHMSGIPHHTHLHPSRNVYLTSWFILSVLFFDRQWDICDPYRCPECPVTQTSTLVATSTWLDGSFCLCCFWQAVGYLWSLHVSAITHHMEVHNGRNYYLTSWFILSVLFLTGGGTSVVPTCGRDLPSHGPPRWKESLPDQVVHSVCVVFDRRRNVCGPYMCPGSPVTWTSTLEGKSTWPAGSFCLCCFWQVVRHLWSLHMSLFLHHTDFRPGRNVYLTSWFILSGYFLTGGKTSVVPTCVWDLPSHGRPPQYEPLPNQLVYSVCIVFDRQWDVCGPYTCPGSPITQTSTPVGMSSWLTGSFWLYCFW